MLLKVVDKQRGLPSDYAPADLQPIEGQWSVPGFEGRTMRREAAEFLIALLAGARSAGYDLRLRSGFRSYAQQVETFQMWVKELGQQRAMRESAPAGHSEHQLGTAADLSSAAANWQFDEFGGTPEAKWLATHAYEYGFALSYPRESEAITGYVWEPWHVRYLGRGCAAAWRQSGTVLVRFLEAVAQQ
jgi:D-alanyl-D-alanine carboxypeptidase